MPNRRHSIHAFGAVAAGNQSDALEVSEFTKGIVYLDRAAVSGAVVAMEVSPDGTNWHTYFDQDDADQYVWTVGSNAQIAVAVRLSAQWIRFDVTIQDMDGIWFEGIREVA